MNMNLGGSNMQSRKGYLSVDEYLAMEERSQIKHEYVDGLTFAMSGATDRHNVITANIYTALRSHLRGSSCRARLLDMKVHVKAANSLYYPDVLVACGSYD